jgi:hypothetical protein
MITVKTIEHLKELAKDGREFTVRLNGGARSSKYIAYLDGTFYIESYITGEGFDISEAELVVGETNIMKAIEMGALIAD